jgi:diguanylate cyclase (GGDEF)-like protein
MDGAVKVLVVEDNPVDARVVTEFLTPGEGFEVTHVGCLSEASAALGEGGYDAVLLDLMLPDSHGLATVGNVQDRAPDLPIVVYSGFGADDVLFAREAIRTGAQEFLPKSLTSRTVMQRAILSSIERKRLEQRRVRFARHDELTGLPNRLLLEERFARAVARSDRQKALMAVLAVDLDYFLQMVEQMGSEFGDRLFTAVANRLETKLRKCDTLARTRERRFVGLLEGLSGPDQLAAIARRMGEIMAPPFHQDDHEVFLAASVGIAIYPVHGRSLPELIAVAEDEMFQVATAGGNAFQVAAIPTSTTPAEVAA